MAAGQGLLLIPPRVAHLGFVIGQFAYGVPHGCHERSRARRSVGRLGGVSIQLDARLLLELREREYDASPFRHDGAISARFHNVCVAGDRIQALNCTVGDLSSCLNVTQLFPSTSSYHIVILRSDPTTPTVMFGPLIN